jgi:hypothetical protein
MARGRHAIQPQAVAGRSRVSDDAPGSGGFEQLTRVAAGGGVVFGGAEHPDEL